METHTMDKDGNILAVTVDINERFVLSWAKPTEDHHAVVVPDAPIDRLAGVVRMPDRHDDSRWITQEGVSKAILTNDNRVVLLSYGKKANNIVVMYSSLVPILEQYDIVKMLKPSYFFQSRTGGRICVRRDGLEMNLLALLGDHFELEDPSWITRKCFTEDPTEVVDTVFKPIGGTKEYMKKYYFSKTDVRRTKREEVKKVREEAKIRAKAGFDTIDDLIASMKGERLKTDGGGGPLASDSKRTILGRDIGRGDSWE
jgi:hypothetical protein